MTEILGKGLAIGIIQRLRINTAPRWLVLLIDMLIVLFSFAVIAMYDHFVLHMSPNYLLAGTIVMGVYFVFTYVFKSYAFIIRLSMLEDLYRVFLVVAFSTSLLLLLNIGVSIAAKRVLFSYWSILQTGVMAFTLLIAERLLIKHLYASLKATMNTRRRVLVLGTSLNSIILANALKNESGGLYEPIGLLATKSPTENTSAKVNGFKVYPYNPQTLAGTFVKEHIHALIFSAENNALMHSGFADYFLKNNITLLAINSIKEFELDDDTPDENENISTHIKEVQIEDLLGRDPIVLKNALVRNHINGSVVLITGACGSIGSEIVRQVATYKAKHIILVDQAETPMHDISLEMKQDFPNTRITLYIGDVENRERMERAFEMFRPDYVFHAAAYKHVPMMEINPTEAIITNVCGTINVADLALKYDVKKFVMISTDKAVNPTNIMGCSKRLAEVYTQSLFFDAVKRGKKTQFITTRFGNVLGSNGSVIPLFRRQIENGGPVTVTHRDIIRYFMTIPEACSLVLEAGCMGHGGEIYIFDMGKPVKIYNLARKMISLAGLRPDIDIKIEEVGLRPGEKLYEELLNDKENTISTENDKIMIAKVRTYDYKDVCNHINVIAKAAREGKVHDMVLAMKEFIPEYKSNQSEFEAIDRELEKQASETEKQDPETEKYY